MNENMGSAPHRPMSDKEILDRLVQTRKEIESEGRLFYRVELVFISDLISECEHRGALVEALAERLAQVEKCRMCGGDGSVAGAGELYPCDGCDGTGLAHKNAMAAQRKLQGEG